MKRRIASLIAMAALVSGLLVTPLALGASSSATSTGLMTPVTGTAKNAKHQTVNFTGKFKIKHFVSRHGHLRAQGTITGTLKNAVTGHMRHVSQAVSIPVVAAGDPAARSSAAAATSCDILHLTLGPLNLNLLGLVVHLDRVVLDITAVTGPGNLLGNLLCAITGILDGGLPMPLVAQILNTILAILSL
jgi:hypothetical protein